MLKPKRFIAISTGIVNGKLVLINTSVNKSLYDENGISFEAAIEFLFSLIWLKDDKTITVFVSYAFSRDNEFLFSMASNEIKDRLFQSRRIRNEIDKIEFENENLDAVLFDKQSDVEQFADATIFRTINGRTLNDLTSVENNGYEIRLANGKFLQIKRAGRVITFYDVYGFFKPKSLRESVFKWLGYDLELLDKGRLNRLESINDLEKAKLFSILEATAVSKLMALVNLSLEANDIRLTRFHGASSLSSFFLSRLRAKDEFYNYRYQRQMSGELHKAMRQSNYGGRVEQFKIGTVKNVFIYDINSAYAYACTFLPKMLRKPIFRTTWDDSPFSCWFVNYDFRNIDTCYFGYFPNRDFSTAIKYKLKGRGYFWQPEVAFALQHFPECIEIKKGYSLPYERADFALGIERLYKLRQELKEHGSPLEGIIKLALASIYGKFCQQQGRGHYYNLFYAGFITSFTRAMLLNATYGYEKETICFQTDAIHSFNGNLPVDIDSNLGGYKREFYDQITYLDNGVYKAVSPERIKIKSRGFRVFDFDNALNDFQSKRTYSAIADFFIGHNLFTEQMFKGAEYLNHYQTEKTSSPLERDRSAMRLFEALDIDLTVEHLDSLPLRTFTGLESTPYKRGGFKESAGLDSIEAGRL